jgi:hypothetical protein
MDKMTTPPPNKRLPANFVSSNEPLPLVSTVKKLSPRLCVLAVKLGASAYRPRNKRAFRSEFRVYAAKGDECPEPPEGGTPNGGQCTRSFSRLKILLANGAVFADFIPN